MEYSTEQEEPYINKERVSNGKLVVFMLGNIHSELLCGNPESENMIHFEHHDHGTFVAVCDADDEGIKQRCKNLIKRTGKTNNHFCWNK